MNQVLVKGNVVEGFKHFGPFETRTDAFQHMKDVSDHETDWVVADLLPPVNQVEDLTPEQWQEGMQLTQIGVIDEGTPTAKMFMSWSNDLMVKTYPLTWLSTLS